MYCMFPTVRTGTVSPVLYSIQVIMQIKVLYVLLILYW